jgi:hypothetical protein
MPRLPPTLAQPVVSGALHPLAKTKKCETATLKEKEQETDFVGCSLFGKCFLQCINLSCKRLGHLQPE